MATNGRVHSGTHPITETTCDDPRCWCNGGVEQAQPDAEPTGRETQARTMRSVERGTEHRGNYIMTTAEELADNRALLEEWQIRLVDTAVELTPAAEKRIRSGN